MKKNYLCALMIVLASFSISIWYYYHLKAVIGIEILEKEKDRALQREKIQNDNLEKEKDRALQREIMEFKKSHKP